MQAGAAARRVTQKTQEITLSAANLVKRFNVGGGMHIIGGQVQSQGQHQFSHRELQIGLQQGQLQSRQPQNIAPVSQPKQPVTSSSTESNFSAPDISTDKDLSLLKALFEALTGKTMDILTLADISPPPADVNVPVPAAGNSRVAQVDAVQISETESTQVAFQGQFDTADGSHISLDLEYSLERSYSATNVSANIINRNAKDPLVLNFNGLGAALDPKQTAFDLNGDGQNEAIATLASGSAYLALDRNNNGRIDNGTELFGPTSDNGYAELAKLDSDGNGFIDSADPSFSKLLLFRPGEATQTLASADVGAIFLGSEASPARLTDRNNQSLGQLRATGFYLTNQGGAGLVQELDLTV
jgi:hypothetical protein